MTIRIATFNVNSIRARKERFALWLSTHAPDIVCLQETKVVDADFPRELAEAAGYFAELYGQKTYNGVALLSKTEITNVERGFAAPSEDTEARWIAGTTRGLRVASAYVPNGNTVGSPKWHYKLEWLRRMRVELNRYDVHLPLVIGGDYNIAPADLDAAQPEAWASSVLCHEEGRALFRELLDFGLIDAFRARNPDVQAFSWWDYQMLAFPKNNGLRIDHLLVTPSLFERCLRVSIDRDTRKTGAGPKDTKPSDHAPVFAEFSE